MQRVSRTGVEEYPHPYILAVKQQGCLIDMQRVCRPDGFHDVQCMRTHVFACPRWNVVCGSGIHGYSIPHNFCRIYPVWHATQKVINNLLQYCPQNLPRLGITLCSVSQGVGRTASFLLPLPMIAQIGRSSVPACLYFRFDSLAITVKAAAYFCGVLRSYCLWFWRNTCDIS